MMILVTGGSGSGKSAYAESVINNISEIGHLKKYYVATMHIGDKESLRKAERHRRIRRGKDFLTIEQPVSVYRALEKMEVKKQAALVECISNLTANEMFLNEMGLKEGMRRTGMKTVEYVAEKILKDVGILRTGMAHLVVVSNNVFEDGTVYDEAVKEYMEVMGRVNRQLAWMADKVTEVVAGIPVTVK